MVGLWWAGSLRTSGPGGIYGPVSCATGQTELAKDDEIVFFITKGEIDKIAR